MVVYRAYGGKFKDGWEGWRVPDAGSEVEERRDERVRDPRVVYAVVRVDVDGDEGLLWLQAAIIVADHVARKTILREMNGSNECEGNG